MPASSKDQILVRCRCGETFHSTRAYIGRLMKCPVCSQIVTVEPPSDKFKEIRNIPPMDYRIPLAVVAACALWVAGFWANKAHALTAANRHQKEENAALEQARQSSVSREQAAQAAQIAEQDKAQSALLSDPAFVSGELAKKRRGEEWSARLAHDTNLVSTALETNLVLMARIGSDPSIAAQQALEQVARMVAPPGSRIEVTDLGDGYQLRVAFLMSALTSNEAGAVTKHHSVISMREEIQELSARVTRTLFDYCGSRNIQKLSVTCNHALRRSLVPPEATAAECKQLLDQAPVTLGRLYRVSLDQSRARKVKDWRTIPERRVVGLMTVEIDNLRTLTISSSRDEMTVPADPQGQLEF